MKIKNTIENKVKFYSQYFGQNLWFKKDWENYDPDEGIIINGEFLDTIDENDCIFLKSLQEITDEDAIELGKLCLKNDNIIINNTANNIWIESSKSYIQIDKYKQNVIICDILSEVEADFNTYLLVADYLRSKGYALPWMDLSVDDLVEYGWIKLKEK